jgi:hypothetical protein
MWAKRVIWIAASVLVLVFLAVLVACPAPTSRVSVQVLGITNAPTPHYLILVTNRTDESYACIAAIESFEKDWREVNQGIHSFTVGPMNAITTTLPKTTHKQRRVALTCVALNTSLWSRWRARLLSLFRANSSQEYHVYVELE